MKMKFLFLLTLVFTFFGCVDLKKEDYLKRISKLERALDNMEQKLQENQIDSLVAWKQTTNGVELRIKNYLTLDTIDLILGKKIDAYKLMRRNWIPLGKQFLQLKTVMSEERKTLKDLARDIEAGAGDRAAYEQYLLFEKNKIKQLEVLLQEYVKLKAETVRTYQTLHNELNLFSIELLRKYKLKHL